MSDKHWIILLVLLAIYFYYQKKNLHSSNLANQDLRRTKGELEANLNQIQVQKKDLEEQVEQLKTLEENNTEQLKQTYFLFGEVKGDEEINWEKLQAKIKIFIKPHLLEHFRTFQEWLDNQYPDDNIRKYITRISSYRINAVRRSWDIKWNLHGGKLDLTMFPNLEAVYFESHEMASPLTELDITGCKKIRRIYIGHFEGLSEELIRKGIIKSHLTSEQLKKIIEETEESFQNRFALGGFSKAQE